MYGSTDRVKVVVTGSSGVGKTSTIRRLRNESFLDLHEETSGVDYSSSAVNVREDGDRILILDIWDTSGKQEDAALTSVFYQGADIILMMFDITRGKSFSDLHALKDIIKDSLYPNVIPLDKQIILVGNKLDLDGRREVKSSTAETFAEEIGAKFFEISAKTGTNTCKLFRC